MIDEITQGDCLEVMPQIPNGSVDMILCDLPYGMTQNKWDSVIPLDALWVEYRRLLKPCGVVALTASQPFTSILVMSNLSQFRHEWIWIKDKGSNFANTVREPMKEHESVLVFSAGKWTYNKQMQERAASGLARAQYPVEHNTQTRSSYRQFEGREHHNISELRVPSSWQRFTVERGLHPTQKPVALFEYLICTYTNENEVVLDNCIGSGTTAVAALKSGRHFIGIEKDEAYAKAARDRVEEWRSA